MKQLFLFLFAICLTAAVNAQTLQGNMMAGGTLLYYSTSFEGNSDVGNSFITFSPSLGYFIQDNFAVGASLIVGSSTDDNGSTKTVGTSFGIGPFARYYKYTSNENFAFFGQAQLLYISGKNDVTPGGESKTSTISFALSPGFSYFFNEHWALDFSISGLVIQTYDPNTDTDDNRQTSLTFGISSFAPNLGFRYHFGK